MEFELNNVFSVPQDYSSFMGSGWMCDFHFGYGLDVIEEDALNEKFCIQVLRIMIAKADTEIDELEKDLVFLQSELAWTEYDEWSQICCNTLRKKFDNLYVMVRNLENKDEDDFEVSLLMHRKPAEKVHEIVKALLNDYFKEKDKQIFMFYVFFHELKWDIKCFPFKKEQALDVDVLDSSAPPGHAAELLEESTKISDSDSYAIVKEDIQEPNVTPIENGAILRTSLMLQEKKAKISERVKLVNISVKDFNPQSLKPGAVHGDNRKELSSFDLKCVSTEEPKEMVFSLKDKNEFQNLSLKSPDKSRYNQDTVKVQPAVITYKYFCRSAIKHVASQGLSTSNPKILSEHVDENSSTCEEDIVSDSSLHLLGKVEDLDEGMKLGNAAIKDSASNACRHETDFDKGMTTMWKSDLKVGRNEEIITWHTTSSAGVKSLESPSNPEGKGNPPKVDKPSKIILHKISNDALSLSHSTGLTGKRNNSDSSLATSRQAKSENSDVRLDASKHMPGLSGRRSNSDSSLDISRKEKGGNSDVSPNTLQDAPDRYERRSNSDSVLATVRQFKVGKIDVSPTLGRTNGLNQRRNHSDSSLGTFRQAKCRYGDMDQKLCDFAQKSVRKRCIKESNFTLTDKIDSSHSSSEVEKKVKPSQRTVKFEKAGLIDNEHSVLTSFLELQDEKNTTNAQPEAPKLLLEEVQMAETAANDEKFDLDSSVKRQKLKAKKKIESNPLSDQNRGFLSIELVCSSSLISKSKRQWKSGSVSDSSSNQSLDRDAMKKISDHQCGAEEASAAPGDSQILISKPQKKRKKNPSLPFLMEIKGSTVETDISISQSHPNDSAGKDDLSITALCSIDSCTEAVASSCFSTSKLKNMKVGDLRMIAKEKKLTKYSKLRKSDLIQRIVNHLGCC